MPVLGPGDSYPLCFRCLQASLGSGGSSGKRWRSQFKCRSVKSTKRGREKKDTILNSKSIQARNSWHKLEF